MNYTFKMIRRVAGKNIKSLYLPIVLSCLDALLHMGMFSAMVLTIIELIGGIFTVQKLTLYSVILVLLFLVRAILFSVNYTQVQYRGADISAQQRLALGDHIRSLNLGYFNKNSIGRLMSTLTTDITDFEQVLTHSLASLIKVLFFSALALLFAFMVSWQYGLIATVLILIAFPLMRLSGEMSQKYGGRQRASVSRVISRIVEYINGIRTFKLYNMTGEKFQRLDDSFTSLKKDSVKLELSIMPFSISFSFVTSLILPAALILAPALYQAGVIDTQRMIALPDGQSPHRDHGDGGVALDFRVLSGAQEQYGAEDGNDHYKGHFVGDLQHGGDRHCAECHMGQTVADEGKPFQHQRHTQQGGAKRDQHTDNERIADKGVCPIESQLFQDSGHWLSPPFFTSNSRPCGLWR